jgi:lipopolysaccharide transport protein LptA
MAAPHLKRILASLLALHGVGLLGARAASEDRREALPIVIDAASSVGNIRDNTIEMRDVTITQGDLQIRADKASVVGGLNYQDSKWTISGDVRINAQGGNLQADAAVVLFSNNLITRATITGAPAQFEQQGETGMEPARGRAKTIDYETATGNVSLKGEAWLSDGCKEARADQLVYNIRTQSGSGQAAGAAASPGGTGRVRFVIKPQSQSGMPCNAPRQKP